MGLSSFFFKITRPIYLFKKYLHIVHIGQTCHNKAMNEPKKLYVSIREFSYLQKAFSLGALYKIRFRCKENGYETAFIKTGKRVIIDVDEFWACARKSPPPIIRKRDEKGRFIE